MAGMLRNRRLARATADAGFGQAVRMPGYKTAWNGGDSPQGGPSPPVLENVLRLRRGESQAGPLERTYVCTAVAWS